VKETDIVRAICDYLALKRHFFWRQNTGGMYREGRFFKPPVYAINGVPDIILIKDGQFIGLEVKQPKGRMSPDQLSFARKAVEAGAQYHVVRSIDDIISLGL
jgi:hypothetical protein